MHRAKSRGTLALALTVGFLLTAIIIGVFFYWRLQARTHDTSGMVLVNMVVNTLTKGK